MVGRARFILRTVIAPAGDEDVITALGRAALLLHAEGPRAVEECITTTASTNALLFLPGREVERRALRLYQVGPGDAL